MVLRLWLLSLLIGCIPRTGSPVISDQGLSVRTTAVVLDANGQSLEAAEDALVQAITEQLSLRNLGVVPVSARDTDLNLIPLSQHRLIWLANQPEEAELVLLLDARADFFAQMIGRYRWLVKAELILADPANLDQALTRQLEVPVFLQYHHLREADAIEAATPTLMREFGTMLDAWILAPE